MHLFEALLIVFGGQLTLAAAVMGGDRPRWTHLLPLVLLAPLAVHLAVEGAVAFERATSSGPGSTTLSDVPIAVSLVARLPFKQGELAAYDELSSSYQAVGR